MTTERNTIYLDQASTTWPKPARVVEAMSRFIAESVGSPGRAGHKLAAEAERVVHDTRVRLAKLFHAPDPDRIVHCLNGTDALNMAIKGVLREGDHVVTTDLEHNSVQRPLQARAEAGFITLTRVPFDAAGRVDPDAIAKAIRPETRLIAVLHASNVVGTIQPIAEIGRIVRERDCLFLVDAAQTAGVVEIDVEPMAIDLLAFPGHKELLGPTGTGGLFVGARVTTLPWREGGTGADSLHPTQPTDWPTWMEAGTPNTAGLAGLRAALEGLDPPAELAHAQRLIGLLADGLRDVPGVRILCDAPASSRVGVLSFTVDHALSPGERAGVMGDVEHSLSPGERAGVRGEPFESAELGAILDESFGICVRPGLHCAPYVHRALGTAPDGAIRASVARSNTEADVDALVAAVRGIVAG